MVCEEINYAYISGQVIAIRYDKPGDKIMLTVRNSQGSFFVEILPASKAPRLAMKDHVIVAGMLRSFWNGHCDVVRMCVHTVEVV